MRQLTIAEINTVSYIGAGTMGCYNSLVAAVSGYNVVVYDLSAESLGRVAKNQAEVGEYLVASGFCSPQDLVNSASRITCTNDLAEATADPDLVSESISEQRDAKRELHAQLDELCPQKTILTTNTSGLLVSDIEDVVSRGDRFAALHSHLGSPLIDIVGGRRTSQETIDILTRYVQSLGCAPLVLHKEHRGYVLNALLGSVLTTALMLVVDDVASKQEVDSAWMRDRRAPMGPFGMMDLFGLNVVYDGWQHREPNPMTDAFKPRVLSGLQPYLDRGELGRKVGKGFYQYPNPAFEQPGFLLDNDNVANSGSAMTAILLGNAILLAANDIASPEEIDFAWSVGMTLDTGPFGILEEIGFDAARQMLIGPSAPFSDSERNLIDEFLSQLENRSHVVAQP